MVTWAGGISASGQLQPRPSSHIIGRAEEGNGPVGRRGTCQGV